MEPSLYLMKKNLQKYPKSPKFQETTEMCPTFLTLDTCVHAKSQAGVELVKPVLTSGAGAKAARFQGQHLGWVKSLHPGVE